MPLRTRIEGREEPLLLGDVLLGDVVLAYAGKPVGGNTLLVRRHDTKRLARQNRMVEPPTMNSNIPGLKNAEVWGTEERKV
ncbi:MAG: hypothetical protein ACRDSJ_24755, partial [Rubrobacteraceae bacterium]